jgi:hypothetical protein
MKQQESPILDLERAGWIEVTLEMARPHQATPGAVGQLFWRIATAHG